MRIGAKNRPFYRIVAVDDRKKRTGGYLDLIGNYNPLSEPKEIKIDQEKVDAWVKKGAQLSTGFQRIIGKAAQKPPRKPKNDKGGSSSSAPAPEASAAPAAPVEAETAPVVEETPTEESAKEESVAVEEVAEVTPEASEETAEEAAKE